MGQKCRYWMAKVEHVLAVSIVYHFSEFCTNIWGRIMVQNAASLLQMVVNATVIKITVAQIPVFMFSFMNMLFTTDFLTE